jgi:hypothetical protein
MDMLSPLVGHHNRVGGDMIVVVTVEIIGRQMSALTRQGCQLVTTFMLKVNKILPSGITGCQLETQLTGNNESSNKLQHTDKLL